MKKHKKLCLHTYNQFQFFFELKDRKANFFNCDQCHFLEVILLQYNVFREIQIDKIINWCTGNTIYTYFSICMQVRTYHYGNSSNNFKLVQRDLQFMAMKLKFPQPKVLSINIPDYRIDWPFMLNLRQILTVKQSARYYRVERGRDEMIMVINKI